MDAPDTSNIPLEEVCNWRDFWRCLRQLRDVAKLSYDRIEKRSTELDVHKLAKSTLSDLIGDQAGDNQRRPLWETVRSFVLTCEVPETELAHWRAAWGKAIASDAPTWEEEQEYLQDLVGELTAKLAEASTRIEELATALKAAETRATDAEKALAAYKQPPGQTLLLPESLERLRISADSYRDKKQYKDAAHLYGQIAAQLEDEYGPHDRRALHARRKWLEAKTYEVKELRLDSQKRSSENRKLDAHWKKLICDYQHWLSDGDPDTLALRLQYAFWASLLGVGFGIDCDGWKNMLEDLYADCVRFLPPDSRFTKKVQRYWGGGGLGFYKCTEDWCW
jgi:hypothetical protein